MTDFSKPARPRIKNNQWMNGVLAERERKARGLVLFLMGCLH